MVLGMWMNVLWRLSVLLFLCFDGFVVWGCVARCVFSDVLIWCVARCVFSDVLIWG